MKAIAASQLVVSARSARQRRGRSQGLLRRCIGRRAADVWLNLLFWTARHAPRFAEKTKPLFMWGTWTFSPVVRNNTLANARWLLGETSGTEQRQALAKSVIGNFYDFVCDVGRSIGAPRRQLLDRIDRVDGHEAYCAVRAEGRGAIVVTAHMGSFEVGMAALLDHEKRVHVLFRRDALGLFERTRSALRRQLGVIEACVDDGLPVWMKLREALAADDVVLIQGDRVMPGQKGRPAKFMGGHMVLPTGPVKLALASGAPIVPIFSIRNPDGRIHLFIEGPIRVNDAASANEAFGQMVRTIEKYVRQFPGQWLMIKRAWQEDQPSAGLADRLGDPV